MRSDGSGDEEDIKSGEFAFLPERTCAICYQDQNATSTSEAEVIAASGASGIIGSAQTDITNPYETIPCGCIYCFVCLAGRLEAEEGEGWTCLRCGEEVKECKPWSGDVIEEVKKSPSSSKTVGFSDGPKEMAEVEPRPEDDEKASVADLKTSKDGGSSSEPSELGESEAYDEEEEGAMDDDDDG
jgi:peroxin-2